MTPEASALAALLVAGHALGDFVFQTHGMIRRKARASGLAAHGAVVAVCQLGALTPFLGTRTALAVLAIVVAHVAVDAVKVLVSRRSHSRELEVFALDQLAHLLVLAAAWAWLAPQVRFVDVWLAHPAALATVGALVAGYAFNVNGMSAVVMSVLARCRLAQRDGGPSAGRLIGILERMFALTLVLLDHWEALGFLAAAKSLARFKELDERRRAEYYLVGTLASLLGATATAILLKALLHR
ncbi:MAG: DUF3307 domain-containing protein [bacterium]